jgi:hypothetical protein
MRTPFAERGPGALKTVHQRIRGRIHAGLIGSGPPLDETGPRGVGRAPSSASRVATSLTLVFERFTERARQVVVLAHEEAVALRHNYIGTEHILLGLLREQEGLAARILESSDIRVERVRAQVVRIVGWGEEVPSGQIPFTPRATTVLRLALREALSLGHRQIGTEHILLGLIREGEGVAARVLVEFDADPDAIWHEVIRVLGAAPSESSAYQGASSEPAFIRPGDEPVDVPSDLALGWRRRPIALAALGAAVLARMAFDPSRTGQLGRLEMQVLAHLALGPPDTTLTFPGELLESLATALACDHDDLRHAVLILTQRQLVNCEDEQEDDQRITITTAGLIAVQSWLERTTPLFGRWPPDQPAADDATG